MNVKPKPNFLSILNTFHLLNSLQRKEAHLSIKGIRNPEAVAPRLVDTGTLTNWQAGRLLPGKRKLFAGKYKLAKFCGRGGMGTAFKPEQSDIGRTVAIKVLHRSLLRKPRSINRFFREMRLAACFDHPNLVVAYQQ